MRKKNEIITFNDRRPKGFNMLFVSVNSVNKEKDELTIEKYYVEKKRYEEFANRIINTNNGAGFSYRYYTQKISLSSFLNLLDIKKKVWMSDGELIENLNFELKDRAINLSSNDPKIENYLKRKKVNDYLYEIWNSKDRTDFLHKDSLKINEGHTVSRIFRLYNVGQGAMSALLEGEERKPILIFDLGRKRQCKPARELLLNQLSIDYSTTLFVSHFDNDHINMSEYIPDSGTNIHLVIPEFLHPSDLFKPNISLLIWKAINNGNCISVIQNNSLTSPLAIGCIKILQGNSKKKDRCQSTDENSHGLIVELTVNQKKVLIPGDVLYKDIYTHSCHLSPHYIIIPHHACEYSQQISPKIIDKQNLIESFTFCGPNRRYHHPNISHFKQYYHHNGKRIPLIRLASKKAANIVFNGSKIISDSYYLVYYDDYYDWLL